MTVTSWQAVQGALHALFEEGHILGVVSERIYTHDMGAVFAEIAAGNDGDLLHTAVQTDPRYI